MPISIARIPILTYHSLDDSGSPLSMPPLRFRRQMEYLRAARWQSLTQTELLAGHAQGGWPRKSFCLTFDDGFRNFATRAMPVIEECRFSATVFIVAGQVGRISNWAGQPAWAPRIPLLDWSEVRSISQAGIEIGAHTLTHPRL